MTDENTPMPEARDEAHIETQDAVEVHSGGETQEYISLDDLTPEIAAQKFGLDEASVQVAAEVGETLPTPEELRAEADEQETEDSDEGDETPEESSISENDTETDSDGDDATTEPEKFIVDIKDAVEQGLVLSMKIDGEFREFDGDEIQKIIGTSVTADEKSRRASEQLDEATAALENAEKTRNYIETQAKISAVNQQLIPMANEIREIDAQISEARSRQDVYTVEELQPRREELAKNYGALYQQAEGVVNQNEQMFMQQQQGILASTPHGKRYLEDADYRGSVQNFISEMKFSPSASAAVGRNGEVLGKLIELHDLQKSVKPVKRKKKPISQHLRGASSAPKTQPVPKSPQLKERLTKGNLSLSDIQDNPSLLSEL